jgi:hypothetical protein
MEDTPPQSTIYTNGSLSNFDKWMAYTDSLTSPNSFIVFGFYHLISACLQRRVWCPPSHKPIWLNQFTNFVAPPGVGKGLVTTEVWKFLNHHKKADPSQKVTTVTSDRTGNIKSIQKDGVLAEVDRTLVEAAALADYNSAVSEEERGGQEKVFKSIERPLLFPVAAKAITYEALVSSISRALRRKNYIEYDPTLGRNLTKIYTHSSISFCLEEITSLFRKRADDTLGFLQEAWDCGDYKKDTKTQGTDRIKNCCVNLIGGTTPDNMRRMFRDQLLNDGYASRTIFIYEPKDRKTSVFFSELTDYQKQCEQDILAHIKNLSELYGQVELEDDARVYIEKWWIDCQTNRPNVNENLQDYYARKKVHVIKMWAAVHFAESLEMKMGLSSLLRAIKLLDQVEKRMHHALVQTVDNPYFKLGKKVLQYLEDDGKKTLKQLFARFWEDLSGPNPRDSLERVLEHYIIVGRINTVGAYYDIIRETKDINPDEEEINT